MRRRDTPLDRPRRRRFNPKLHPLLAVGIGLGLLVLLMPHRPPEAEEHSDAEILAALTAGELDPAHGPLFWLAEQRNESPLYAQALAHCEPPRARLQPNCQMLHRLEALRQPLPEPEVPLALPTEPPAPDGEPSQEET
jgi:hypothetical protein